jgi:hypothetical protein
MTFQFEYQEVTRKPNPMVTINPLKKGTGKVVSLQDRVDKLQASHAWNKTIKEWKAAGKKFDLARIPKAVKMTLGSLFIDEDIQRELDEKHCANKIASPDRFDPALLEPIKCIVTSDGQAISTDQQHTASTIAGLIAAGLLDGVEDWRTFEYTFWVVETDNRAFARRSFNISNGRGKKPQSKYMLLRTSVFLVRLDNDTSDQQDVDAERLVGIAEKHNVFPVEEKSALLKYPGTFTNIATFLTLNDDELELATAWHDEYFHYEGVHVNLFFIFKDIVRGMKAAKLPITSKLLAELAAMVQSLFINLAQFSESVKEAHRKWSVKRYGYQANWDDDAYACALLQLYTKFGGKEKIAPTLLDKFDGIIEFFDNDILAMAA